MQPSPEDLGRQTHQAAQDTLAALVESSIDDTALRSFPALFTLLEDKKGTIPKSQIERIMTMPLTERPLLLICLMSLEPRIRVLWGVQYFTPYFERDNPEDGEMLAFAQDIHIRMLPTTMRVNPYWLTVREVPAPTIAEINTALTTTGP